MPEAARRGAARRERQEDLRAVWRRRRVRVLEDEGHPPPAAEAQERPEDVGHRLSGWDPRRWADLLFLLELEDLRARPRSECPGQMMLWEE